MKRPLACLACLLLAAWISQLQAQATPTCNACGKSIEGKYHEVEGRFYHPDHLLCEQCNLPLRDKFMSYHGRNYHAACYETSFTIKCFACNKVITDSYYEDYWKNTYHTVHLEQEAKCEFCGRLIVKTFAPGRVKYPDGRELCGYCSATAVTTTPAARDLMALVAQTLRDEGLVVDLANVNVLLLYRDKLQKLTPDPEYHLLGFTDFGSHAGGVSWGANVSLLLGMTEVQMAATIAHELMHVWQGTRDLIGADDVLLEGSANYVSYVVLKQLGTPEASFLIEQMMKDDRPTYGVGFRRVKDYVEQNGFSALLTVSSSKELAMPDAR